MEKVFRRGISVILILGAGLFFFTNSGQAQIKKSALMDGDLKLHLVSPDNIPRFGTFWSLQRTHFPPLPLYAPFLRELNTPVYVVDAKRGIYVVDDSKVDYVAIYKAREEEKAFRKLELKYGLMSEAEYAALEGEGGGMAMRSYTSDELWLEIINYTNTTASLVIHRPVDDDNPSHDIFYSTDLAYPTNWHFFMRTFKTNVLATDLCEVKGFFRLAPTNGSLTITTTNSALNMAQRLVPPWVTVTNANYKGVADAKGVFTGGHGAGLPIETGVILTSGLADNVVGPNNMSNQGEFFNTDSDEDLDLLVGSDSKTDAAVLEFDIVSSNSFFLEFKYIYASEEYPNYISSYNDPMGIFVTTNRVGTNWIITATNNIAIVPGTTNLPVSVATINGGWEGNLGEVILQPTNPKFYVDNFDPILRSINTNAAPSAVFNTQFDGMTVLLKAKCWIQANVTTHIKIGIEDYNDGGYDSAVFLKNWEMDSCGQNQ